MGQDSLIQLSAPPFIKNPEKCSGCGRCVAACPEKLYTLQVCLYRKHARNKAPENCTLCNRCLPACPLGIIHLDGQH